MTKILFCLLFIGYLPQTTTAQAKFVELEPVSIPESNCKSVEDLSSYIKQNYVTDTSRVRAIYTWIANHISYDISRMQEIQRNPQSKPQAVADVLNSRRAVCQGYSELFATLCKNVGINALVVGGYVKTGGRVVSMPHAWVAAEFDGDWFLFDPTWGAGYVANNQFVKRVSNTFYKQYPKDLIADHMPFDPLFQFLSYPKSNRAFIDGTVSNNNSVFNYKDSLVQYNKLSSAQQMAAELRRLEGGGIENDLLQQRREYLKKNLQVYASTNASDEAGKTFSRATSLLNQYFSQKNKQFSTVSDNDLLQSVDSMKYYIKIARALISEGVIQNAEQQRVKTNNLANIDQYWAQLNKEEQFLNKYIATDKALRKQMFY